MRPATNCCGPWPDRLQGALRDCDTLARFGGDEFLVLLEDVKQAADAERVARKLLDALAEPVEAAGQRIAVSASIGIALFPGEGADLQALIQATDAALYRAKVEGRGRFCLGAGPEPSAS
jgi:diguanylate cyclase (GGDEF)-like protein